MRSRFRGLRTAATVAIVIVIWLEGTHLDIKRNVRRSAIAMAAALASAVLPLGAAACGDPASVRGHTFVVGHCAVCHAVEATGDSPIPEAPPFRTLHLRYPVADLEESFAEGVRTGHAAMPEWRLRPDEIDDLIAYLRTFGR